MDVVQKLCVTADVNNLARMREFVEDAGQSYGFDADTINSLMLAVDEAATNVIVHGYKGQAGLIDVEVRRVAGEAVVTVRDSAPPFDPCCIPAPDITNPLDERQPGGLSRDFTRSEHG
jgi:serine/threonine-protein kinase RsbW